jgi:hypothetical protein
MGAFVAKRVPMVKDDCEGFAESVMLSSHSKCLLLCL